VAVVELDFEVTADLVDQVAEPQDAEVILLVREFAVKATMVAMVIQDGMDQVVVAEPAVTEGALIMVVEEDLADQVVNLL
jgi:hypothetical protein